MSYSCCAGHVADAAEEVAKDIYYSSMHLGPEHIDTTPGYYLMGKVFFKQVSDLTIDNSPSLAALAALTLGVQRKPTEALALFNKVLDIWYKYLVNARSRDEKKGKLICV